MKTRISQVIIFGLIILSVVHFYDCGGKKPEFSMKKSCDELTINGPNNLNAIMFINPHKGVAVGDNGVVTRTYNGGDNWTTPSSVTPKHLYGVSPADSSIIVAVGQSGTIMRTTDGGLNWTPIEVKTIQTLRAVAFFSSSGAYAAGDSGVVLYTTDAGVGWNKVHGDSTQVLTGISYNSASTVKIVGLGGILLSGPAFTLSTIAPQVNLRSIHFALKQSYHTHTDDGFAVGDFGTILKTTDGGTNWAVDMSRTRLNLRSVFLTAPTWGYAVGDSGTVLRYSNNKWKVVPTSTTADFYGVDDHHVSVTEVCVGEGGATMLVCPEQIPGGIPGGIVTSFTPGGDDCSHWTFDLNINSLHYEHGDDILNFNTLTINCNNALNQDRTGAYGWATNDNYHYRSGVLTTGTKNFTGYDLLNPPSTGVTVYVTCCLRTQEFDTPYLIGKFECSVP